MKCGRRDALITYIPLLTYYAKGNECSTEDSLLSLSIEIKEKMELTW